MAQPGGKQQVCIKACGTLEGLQAFLLCHPIGA
ncbi:hypothetical protein JBW_04736 [Pelosinus fermentans JBW45]|uniref:Uncharacterized protein n=1 Tax=Pelosinus fermentans JBW45 TaxID=1192197 RepID=I8U1M3_9FIRM|nr:hypothetical protein JBW_04736 [Pelosinus fermentans JBW45]